MTYVEKRRIGSSYGGVLMGELPNVYLSPGRCSLDTVTNSRGNALMRYIAEEGMIVINGRSADDPEGSFTFVSGQGQSVIDLGLCSLPLIPLISEFTVVHISTGSDHLPIRINLITSSTKTTINPTKSLRINPLLINQYIYINSFFTIVLVIL